MAACQKFQRLSRAPIFLGARAASSSALARTDPANHRLSLLQRQPLGIGTLSNGVRVVTQRRPELATASVGLFRKGGSEQETRETNGISGVFQRLQQRGTQKHSASALCSAVAGLQGRVHSVNERQYNATLLHASKDSIGEGIGVLADMARNPLINAESVETEKRSTLQALDAAQYDLETVVMDNLHDISFQGTTMSLSPMGNTNAIQGLSVEALQQYGQDVTVGNNLCLIVCGDVQHDRVMELAEAQLGSISAGSAIVNRDIRFSGSHVNFRDDDMAQCYTGVAVEAPAYGNGECMALEAARHVLGSYDRSYGVDARHGLSVPAYHTHNFEDNMEMQLHQMFGKYYSNVGLWGTYVICPNGSNHEWVLETVFNECHRLTLRCRPSDVDRAKCEMRGELATLTESPTGNVEYMGRQMMTIGRVVPHHEMDQRIEDIQPEHVRSTMKEYFYDTSPAYVVVGSTDTPAEYHVVKQMLFKYNT